ncbi:hypothetical protein [Marinobacter sp. LN3S78]|uniref:hypothetical protein n=1 Tax=Marinobacter sp. LN3S78 TaxID=3382300 RepID=UPI00387AD347
MTSHRFLTFVEDVSATSSVAGESSEAGKVIELYRKHSGKDPTHLVWLDGIEEAYFSSLSWIGTPCKSSSQSDRDQRRNHLNSLDSKKLSVFLLALHKEGNSAFYDELTEGAWLEISIFNSKETESVPGHQSADYEQETVEVVWTLFDSRVEKPVLSKLRNVFCLDHLDEADFNFHKPINYQFVPYKNSRVVFREIDEGTASGVHHFARRPREV